MTSLTHKDVVAVLGRIDEAAIWRIIATGATAEELAPGSRMTSR